jgi:hypothetical protein
LSSGETAILITSVNALTFVHFADASSLSADSPMMQPAEPDSGAKLCAEAAAGRAAARTSKPRSSGRGSLFAGMRATLPERLSL